MGMNQMKMLNDLRKAQKSLAKEIVEVEAGDGAVIVQITGELKIKSVKIDPTKVDLDNITSWSTGSRLQSANGYGQGARDCCQENAATDGWAWQPRVQLVWQIFCLRPCNGR